MRRRAQFAIVPPSTLPVARPMATPKRLAELTKFLE